MVKENSGLEKAETLITILCKKCVWGTPGFPAPKRISIQGYLWIPSESQAGLGYMVSKYLPPINKQKFSVSV